MIYFFYRLFCFLNAVDERECDFLENNLFKLGQNTVSEHFGSDASPV